MRQMLLPTFAPQRIQRRRVVGWRMPANTVYVGRPTALGNPFTAAAAIESGFVRTIGEAAPFVIECFEAWLTGGRRGRDWWQGRESDRSKAKILECLPTLRGKNLCCWCPAELPCHADVLLKLANAEVTS